MNVTCFGSVPPMGWTHIRARTWDINSVAVIGCHRNITITEAYISSVLQTHTHSSSISIGTRVAWNRTEKARKKKIKRRTTTLPPSFTAQQFTVLATFEKWERSKNNNKIKQEVDVEKEEEQQQKSTTENRVPNWSRVLPAATADTASFTRSLSDEQKPYKRIRE